MAKERFEEALNKLEKIVARLEKGDIPLEESLKLFEEGVRLSRWCNQKLDEAEKRVEILVKDKDGTLKTQPFDPSTSSGQAPSTGSGQAPSTGSGQAPSTGSGQASSTNSRQTPSDESDEDGSGQQEDSFLNENES